MDFVSLDEQQNLTRTRQTKTLADVLHPATIKTGRHKDKKQIKRKEEKNERK